MAGPTEARHTSESDQTGEFAMLFTRRSTVLLTAACLALLTPALPVYGANPAPRMVSATLLDRDGDDRADEVRLTFSERVWHARDTDGRYPFTVGNYQIRSVGAAKGSKTLTILLKEKKGRDIAARPVVQYRATTSKPVKDTHGKQAAGQKFKKTLPLDRDGDGFAARDCRPADRTVHPGAADAPDMAGFADTNCDGIDGDRALAVFVSPEGSDIDDGTAARPLRTVRAGLARVLETPVDDDLYLAPAVTRKPRRCTWSTGQGCTAATRRPTGAALERPPRSPAHPPPCRPPRCVG